MSHKKKIKTKISDIFLSFSLFSLHLISIAVKYWFSHFFYFSALFLLSLAIVLAFSVSFKINRLTYSIWNRGCFVSLFFFESLLLTRVQCTYQSQGVSLKSYSFSFYAHFWKDALTIFLTSYINATLIIIIDIHFSLHFLHRYHQLMFGLTHLRLSLKAIKKN